MDKNRKQRVDEIRRITQHELHPEHSSGASISQGGYFLNPRQGCLSRYEAIQTDHVHSSLAILTSSRALYWVIGL
jgi:hypothetical protein